MANGLSLDAEEDIALRLGVAAMAPLRCATMVGGDDKESLVQQTLGLKLAVNLADQVVHGGQGGEMALSAVAVGVTGPVNGVELDEKDGRDIPVQIVDHFLSHLGVVPGTLDNTEVILDDTVVDRVPVAE